MPSEWSLGYPRYMIDDGCPHVEVGQTLEWFAVEFSASSALAITSAKTKSACEVDDHTYAINAEIIYLSEKACVIDFGLKAIQSRDSLPLNSKEGDFLSGELCIGLPLCSEVVPDDVLNSLAYKWRVERVLADLTPSPYIKKRDSSGLSWLTRDKRHVEYQDVKSTQNLHAESYVLRCSQIV